jgi:hypothetical protein
VTFQPLRNSTERTAFGVFLYAVNGRAVFLAKAGHGMSEAIEYRAELIGMLFFVAWSHSIHYTNSHIESAAPNLTKIARCARNPHCY